MSEKNNMTIEEQFEKLEEIISKMENDEISLEETFNLYDQGVKLVRDCNDKIDTVEKKIKLIEDENNANGF